MATEASGYRPAVKTHTEPGQLLGALRGWRASSWRRRAVAAASSQGGGASRGWARGLKALALLAAVLCSGAAAGEEPPPQRVNFRGKIMEMTDAEECPVKIWGPDGKPILTTTGTFDRKGLALLTRDYGLRLEGGWFYSGAVEDHLGPSLKNGAGELTISALIQPAAAGQEGAGVIFGYGPPRGDLLFALAQEKDALTFRIAPGGAEPYKVEIFRLQDAARFHLTLTVAKDAVVCYRDGKKAAALPGIKGDFSGWANGILYFGNDRTGKLPWRGVVELAALHNRALSAEEAAKGALAILEEVRKRDAVAHIEIEATLLSRPKYPMPWKESFTYREVLAVCEYKVDKVVSGEFKEPKILVAEWMYVDQIFLTNSRKETGSKYRLTVELLNTNPQYSKVERALPLDRDIDRDVYYNLGALTALPEGQQPKPPAKKEEK